MRIPNLKQLRASSLMCLLVCLAYGSAGCQQPPVDGVTGEPQLVRFTPGPAAFALAAPGRVAPVYTDSADWPGVTRAAQSFAGDVRAVTGKTPTITHSLQPTADLILVGTLGRSALIDRLVEEGKLDVTPIRGHWETSVTEVVSHPFPGVKQALVLAGADKRGTIFALYTLSEQMGVSPWSWWADVRIPHHDFLFIASTRYVAPEPRVRYRGIFLNDEAPALTGWAEEKFGGKNRAFYKHVFELLLRLHANYLWPAMWNNAFNEDDPADPVLADEYGIVMGTSHHEPMLRAQQEWKRHGVGPWDYNMNAAELKSFWTEGIVRNREVESTLTIGMRGDGDMAMSATANTALLERIVADQRRIIAANEDPSHHDPQIWALYKEVQEYYEKGMRVPDDVTLLWCDDNWGNIRRLPTTAERMRPGGAGIYYHFDYVGDPRSYKWLLTYNISKVWEQMHLAADYGADRVWIVNVGDLKPMEFPIEFFLNMARNPARFRRDNLMGYTQAWAAREFGPEHSAEIAVLLDTYTRYNARRKPEQLAPDTYSFIPDAPDGTSEADRVDAQWRALTARAEAVNAQLPVEERASFFELVLFPIKASATVGEMYLAAGRNRFYAREGRASANVWAERTRRLFAEDAALTDQYNHHLLAGKWNHMMDQTHIGYTYWNEPPANAMPAISEIQVPAGAHLGVFAQNQRSDTEPGRLPAFDSANRQSRTLVLAPLGREPVTYLIKSSAPWITVDKPRGTLTADTSVAVRIDWTKAPAGQGTGSLIVQSPGSAPVKLGIVSENVSLPVHGFVEDNGMLAIDAEHASANHAGGGVTWLPIPGFTETGAAGLASYPDDAPSTIEVGSQACLDYSMTLLTSGARTLQTVIAPTLPFSPEHGLRFSVAIDSERPMMVDAWAPYTEAAWRKSVSDGVHKLSVPLGSLDAGSHLLRVCRVDPGLVVERFYLFTGADPSQYLGPLESKRVLP